MAIQWLVDRFSPNYDNVQTAKPQQLVSTFKHFPDLPTELRVQIWEYYFDVPRIHVLYQGPAKSQHPLNDPPVAYTDLTAGTNCNVPASLRFAAAAINREALQVFHKTFDLVHIDFMGLPSKHLRDFFDDKFRGIIDTSYPDRPLSMSSIPKDVLQSTPQLAEFVRNPGGKPQHMIMPAVHINWKNDLLYLTDSADVNCEMLRRICNGPIASKLRRMAILIHDSIKYEGWRRFYGPSVDFPKPSAQLTEVILVVRLSDREQSTHAMFERDEFGFVPYDSVIEGKQNGNWEWMQNMKLIERRFVYVAQLLREAFPDLENNKIKVRFRGVIIT
ncbi:hypothetical protein HD806DRAFT_522991 [Xylariaceae sp. AK1471]|nr:hypothetical protein HD806DRAFT_522991 [Xylariaceae sp. AK1471]